MDVFDDVFDAPGDSPAASAATSLAPRASEHPHFRASQWLWPAAAPADDEEPLGHATRQLLRARADACAQAVRKARDTYSSDAATALLAACAAFERDEAAAAADEARRCEDFCAAQLEEGNWSAAAWQEANLLALAFGLAAAIRSLACSEAEPSAEARAAEADAEAEAGGVHERIGRCAVALFNLGLTVLEGAGPDAAPLARPRVERAVRPS